MKQESLNIRETSNNYNEKKIQKLRFCIISNFKNQFCKNNLMMFTLDNI